MGGGIAEVVQEITAGGDVGSIDFIFLRSLVDGVAWVGNLFVGRDITFVDPVKDIHSGNITISLEKSSEFVDTGGVPAVANFFDGVADEFFP